MIDVHSGEPVKSLGNRVLDANTEANLCETCYDIVVTFGIENVLAALGRAARVRAGDYMRTSRQQYLRHQRAASRITAAYHENVRDGEQVDRIVEEEGRNANNGSGRHAFPPDQNSSQGRVH
jgi:hypothetical protein